MKIRNLLGGVSIAALALTCAAPAMATPIPLLGGYTGPIQIVFNDFESFTGNGGLQVSNSNYGLLSVTSVLDGSNNVIYSAPVGTPNAANPLIVGLFSGIHVGSVTSTSAEANTTGHFSFYWDTAQQFGTIAAQGSGGYTTGGCSAVNTQCYNGITNMGYENLLNFDLVPGASSTDPTSYLHAVLDSFNPLVGTAQGYGNVTGGTAAFQIGKRGRPPPPVRKPIYSLKTASALAVHRELV